MHNKHSLSEENKEMLRNQAVELIHHADELMSVLEKSDYIEPWVLAKAERATTDLSDITHYLEGHSEEMHDTDKFEDGGYMEKGGEANDQYVIWVSKGGEKERVYYGTFASKRKAELQQIKLYKTGEYSATGIMPKWAYDKHGFTKYADGGYMEKGGEIKPYILWVSKDGEKREIYGIYKSRRAAQMQGNKIWESGEYESMGWKPKDMYEKEGLY
jgi:hypothetical protein